MARDVDQDKASRAAAYVPAIYARGGPGVTLYASMAKLSLLPAGISVRSRMGLQHVCRGNRAIRVERERRLNFKVGVRLLERAD